MTIARCRSSVATPRRSGCSRSICTLGGRVDAEAATTGCSTAQPRGRRCGRAAQRGVRVRDGSRSRARGPPRTDRSGPASRCRSRSARRPRRSALPAGSRHRDCLRWSGTRRPSCRCGAIRSMSPLRHVDPVNHPRPRTEEPGPVEQRDRRAAVLGLALFEFAALLVGVDMADESVVIGIPRDRVQPLAGTARTLCAAIPTPTPAVRGPAPERVDAREKRLDVRIAEPPLPRRPAAGRRRPNRCGDRQRGASRSAGRPPRAVGDRDRERVRILVRMPSGWWWT